MPGRNRKDVWDNFRRTKKEGNTGVWAICKCCNIGMQGIPARLEKHLEKCVSDRDIEVPVPKQPKKDDSLSSVVSVTNKQEKDKIAVENSESTFKFKVVGFVTDNTGNVTKLRRNLQNSPVCSDISMYGCGAHILNLLGKDLQNKSVIDNVVTINKYFRNHHLPKAWLNEKHSKVLYLPSEVRWNTVFKCLDSYIEAWPHMMSVVEEHREEVSSNIYQFVTNIGLKRSAEDYRKVLHPIAVALDKMQGSRATISDAVMIWHTLSEELNGTLPNEKQLQLSKRREMCLTDFHKLAFLLDPRYLNTNVLDAAEQESALQKAFELHPDLVAVIAQFRAKASPFIKSYYEVAQQINPHDWWSLAADIPQSVKDIIIGLLSCSPSTASLERLFSSYGWIHSEIRNRLGNEKAAKLLFIFKVLNNA